MKYRLLFATATLCALLSVSISLAAAEDDAQIAFFVRPVFSEDQIEDCGYYYFAANSGEARTLAITIVNTNASDARMHLRAVDAATGAHGEIIYPDEGGGMYGFSGMVTFDEETVTVPAQSELSVSAHVRVPEDFSLGEILGGLVVTKIPDKKAEKPGLSIQNLYEYLVAVRIQVGALPKPDFSLGGVRMDVENGMLYLALSSNAQRVLQAARLNVAMAGLHFEKESISFAPNSGAEIIIEDERLKSLPAGAHRVWVSIEYGGEAYTMEAQYEG